MSTKLSIRFLSLKDANGQNIWDVLIYLKRLKEISTPSGTPLQLKEKDAESCLVFNFNHEYILSSDDEYIQVMFLKSENTPEYLVDEFFWLYGLYEILYQTKSAQQNNSEVIHSTKLTGDYTLTFRLQMIDDISSQKNADRNLKSSCEIRGHKLSIRTFDRFVFCAICQEFIWGVSKQGYKCDQCKTVLHIRCRERIPFWCPLSFMPHPCLMTGNGPAQIEIPHVFIPAKRSLRDILNVSAASHCRHCGSSVKENALKCRSCKIIVHEKCLSFLPPLCGRSYQTLKNQLDIGIIREVFNTSDTTDSDSRNSLISTCSSRSSLNIRTSLPISKEPSDSSPKWSDFECIGRLGEGGFSKVYVAQHIPTKEYVTLKVVDGANDEARQQIEREKDFLFRFSHLNPYIINAYCTFLHGSYFFLVTEFVDGDMLCQRMTRKPLNEEEIRYYMVEIISVLQYLHSKRIVYRDLKLEHIIVCKDGYIRLIDYGLAQTMEDDEELCKTICGTNGYLAPEVIDLETNTTDKGYNYLVDYWALGIVFAQLLYGEQFSDSNNYTVDSIDDLVSSRKPTEVARSLLHGLLEVDPCKRLGSSTSPHGKIREHAFFTCAKELDWTEVDEGVHKAVNKQTTIQYNDSTVSNGLPFSRSSINPNCQEEWQEIGEYSYANNYETEFQSFTSVNYNQKNSVFTRKK